MDKSTEGYNFFEMKSFFADFEKKIANFFHGFMYAFQQAGMTIATKVVGMLKDTTGWLGLQMFFTILQLVGLGLSIYLITRIGIHSSKTINNKENGAKPEEEIELKNDNE